MAPTRLERPLGELPFPLEEPGVRLFSQARQALQRCLPGLGLRPDDEVLMPNYHHGSEVEAAASLGLRPVGYEPGEDLTPDEGELESLLTERTRALHLVHYLGFVQDGERWRRWCDRHGLLLIEDAAQAWLSRREGRPAGSWGDLAVFCLYKTVGLPDGAAVISRAGTSAPELRGGTGILYFVKPALRGLRDLGGAAAPHGTYDHVRDIAVPIRSHAESALTRHLLPWIGAQGVVSRRRAAYRVLLDALGDLVPRAFGELPEGTSPFAFPILVHHKPTALDSLRVHEVVGLDLWQLPHPSLPGRPGGPSELLRSHVVGLPVHQDLGPEDLERIVTAARSTHPASTAVRDVVA